MILVCQGRSFENDDINSVLSALAAKFALGLKVEGLSDKEIEDLKKLQSEFIA